MLNAIVINDNKISIVVSYYCFVVNIVEYNLFQVRYF